MNAVVVTFGSFDLLHPGHIRILQRAKALGSRLVVGVSSDALHLKKKHNLPILDETQRMEMVAALACVDDVFLEEALEKKAEYLREHNAGICVLGDDWKGKFDAACSEAGARAIYLPRTEKMSTTILKELIKVRPLGSSFSRPRGGPEELAPG